MAQLVTVHKNKAQFVLPLPARELLRADDSDTVYYQVLGTNGEYLSGEKGLTLPPEDDKLTVGDVRMRDDEFRGVGIKITYT